MAKRSATKIQEYVDAVRDLRAMQAQLAADRECVKRPRWMAEFAEAKRTVQILYRDLKGGELGKATRILAGPDERVLAD